ncbi:hypothetical protein ACHAXN_000540 [Cyclotella atomus]
MALQTFKWRIWLIFMSVDYLLRLLGRQLAKHLWGRESDKRVITKSLRSGLFFLQLLELLRQKDMVFDCGTTGDKMIELFTMILNDIGPGTPARRRCFIMDNLGSHHNDQVAAMILMAGHRIMFRALYWPIDESIEFVLTQ